MKVLVVLTTLLGVVSAFAPQPFGRSNAGSPSTTRIFSTEYSSGDYYESYDTQLGNSMKTIEFTIYPDGTVQERVTGIKGPSCLKITEAINEKIGEVVKVQTTEEFYEQEVVQYETVWAYEGTGFNTRDDDGTPYW
mmetsp:Transcript_21817/g.50333  ORF Transcript_21817/g.50333 Transcript_21817/m.50333 type:complete len:136 (+) Transcript_21817:136-543(+)|eukprot:CAMPEP_0116836644 /NCGR_PEP_ID=MMETSP0418-20121206/8214_1 /TAXON_ID=1158023 /ORGANISM="Astrosyne radiata, Strain 13vi08-1A" /LENGTH=135 /DNA_ID=CAMNT_0004466443 /DNA_START=136 /DNA_END=540 /DNA_ORIENTATION=-